MNPVEIIGRKRDGAELSTDEIRSFISGIAIGSVPDYQSAAWLMAVYLRGMSPRETLDLTLAMRDTGERIDLSDLPNGPAVDKHSTGGVGDKTSLVVVPLLAAAGVPVLKMSGRGLGFSGGTVDKLESIPGFRSELSSEEAKQIVRTSGAVMIAQSSSLAPADKILYALRDVTATIASIPLIASSIMSKKLAAGGQRIVLDVKCGRGAFMKTPERAGTLAAELVRIGNAAGVPTSAVISAMDEPLGRAVGNALEVREAIETLQGLRTDRLFKRLCLTVAAHALAAAGKTDTIEKGRDLAKRLLKDGSALRSFEVMVSAQGGPSTANAILAALPQAPQVIHVVKTKPEYVVDLDAEAIGKLVVDMGGGRHMKSDLIDPAVGIVLHCKCGDEVADDESLASLHFRAEDEARSREFCSRLMEAYTFSAEQPVKRESLIMQTV